MTNLNISKALRDACEAEVRKALASGGCLTVETDDGTPRAVCDMGNAETIELTSFSIQPPLTPEDMRPGAVIRRSKDGEELIVERGDGGSWTFLNAPRTVVHTCHLGMFTLVRRASEASARAVAHAVQTDAKPPHPGVIPAPEPETCPACNRPFGPYRIRMERTPFPDWCGDCLAIESTPAPVKPPERPSRLAPNAQWHLDHTSVSATPDWEA